MTSSIIKRDFACAIFIAMSFGCVNLVEQQVQEHLENEPIDVIFHVDWAPETKTVLQEDGSIWWEPGDSIALFAWSLEIPFSWENYCLRADCQEPSSSTDFLGKIRAGATEYHAISPYENALGYCSFMMPTIQYSPRGSLSSSQIVSFARSKDHNLTFYNAFAGIKFSVTHEGIKKVVFKHREDDYPIAGAMDIQFWTDFPQNPGISPRKNDVSNTVTVYPAEGECFIPGEYYYASIRPGNTSLFVSLYTETQVATIGLTNRVIERSTVATIRDIDKDLIFKEQNNCTYATLGCMNPLLPEGVDKDVITEVVFHTSSDVKTETISPCSVPRFVAMGYYDIDYIPVYFELIGSTAHFYTEADKYRMGGPSCISFYGWHELRSIDLSMFDTSQVTDFQYMFEDCINLESVNLSSFDTSNGHLFWGMFSGCKRLKKLDISNFSSNNASYTWQSPFSGIFNSCLSMVSLDLGDFNISEDADHTMFRFANNSRNCAIRCTSGTRVALSNQISRLGINEEYITWVLPDEEMPELEPYRFDYYSTDFGKDKTFKVLQKATGGNGINIVLLGDGYSDRMISDGSYDEDMTKAMNAIFKDEPYSSFRDCFNVYEVYAVSENETTSESYTALDTFVGGMDPQNGPVSSYDEYYLNKYARVPNADIGETCVIIIVNQEAGLIAGVAAQGTFMEGDDLNDVTDYAKGGSVVMVCRQLGDSFADVVAHEFGHGFAKLADEYVLYANMEEWEKQSYIEYSNKYGWWSNIDFTSDPSSIKWSRFLTDERYAGTDIGIFEGATWSAGAWRPSQTSIMQTNTGMFNAPSREAIYKRINRLAFGKEWKYDYEEFVKYDQKNIDAEKAAVQSAQQIAPTAAAPSAIRSHNMPFIQIDRANSPNRKDRIVIYD